MLENQPTGLTMTVQVSLMNSCRNQGSHQEHLDHQSKTHTTEIFRHIINHTNHIQQE